MLIAAMVCILVAVIALGVGICFVKENKTFLALLSTFALIALICLGVSVMAYVNDFSGFSILLIISVCPLFVNVCLPYKKEEPNTENSIKTAEKTENNTKFGAIIFDFGEIIHGATYLLSTLAIAFCGLYIGKESVFAFLLGISIGLALTFLDSIIKKDGNGKDVKKLLLSYLQKFLVFTSVGLLLGAMLLSLLYSLSTAHILFSLGCLAYAVHILLQKYFKNPYNHLPYLASMILLLATILF